MAAQVGSMPMIRMYKCPPMQHLGSNGRHSAASRQLQAVLFRVTRYSDNFISIPCEVKTIRCGYNFIEI